MRGRKGQQPCESAETSPSIYIQRWMFPSCMAPARANPPRSSARSDQGFKVGGRMQTSLSLGRASSLAKVQSCMHAHRSHRISTWLETSHQHTVLLTTCLSCRPTTIPGYHRSITHLDGPPQRVESTRRGRPDVGIYINKRYTKRLSRAQAGTDVDTSDQPDAFAARIHKG